MPKKHKTLHMLNWFHGNIRVRKCHGNLEKERDCYDKNRQIITGYGNYS